MAANGNLPGMPLGTPRFIDRFSKGQKVLFVVLGYVFGIIGVLIDWAIGRRKKMMECSAEAIWYGLIGWGIDVVIRFILGVTTDYVDPVQGLFGAGVTVWSVLWCICGVCFIILSMLWIYGLRPKMTDAERAYALKGDDHFLVDDKKLRYDAGITVNATPEQEGALRLWFKRFAWTWNWEVYPINEKQSRFIYRCDCVFDPFLRTPIHKYFVVFILGTASIVMGRCCMETITKLSEGDRNFRKRYFD